MTWKKTQCLLTSLCAAAMNSQNYKLKQRVIFVCTAVCLTDEQQLGGKNLITKKSCKLSRQVQDIFSADLPLGFRLRYSKALSISGPYFLFTSVTENYVFIGMARRYSVPHTFFS